MSYAALEPLRSAEFFKRWEFAAQHNLAASAAETLPLADLLAMAEPRERREWDDLTLGYIETRGTLPLRAAIAATYKRAQPDDVLAFSSGKEAIFAAAHVLAGRGDHILTVTPNYQPLEEIPWSVAEVSAVALHPENHWALDLDEVAAALRPQTRLICINVPHNPTGALLDRGTFEGLIQLAAKRGIFILSDEVYRGLELDAADRLPAMVDSYEHGLSLDVMSKTYGLAGLRVGWIATRDRSVLARIEAFKHYLSDGNAGPSEILARIALGAGERIRRRNLDIIRHNRRLLDSFFARHVDRFEWVPPRAGCIAFPRYIGPDGVENFCRRAVTEAGVALMPASVYRSRFGTTPLDRFRIGFGKLSTEAGLAALSDFVDGL